MDMPREKLKKISKWLMLAGITGTVVFAGALAMELAERKRDEAYYASMSALYVTDPVSADLVSADEVIE